MATKPKPDRCAFERKAVEKIEKRIVTIDDILRHPEDLPEGGVERLEKEKKKLENKLPAAEASLRKCEAAARDTRSKKKKTPGAKKR